MSLKKKLVTTIGMFCLTCALLLVGVWAISNASVEIGGTISFNATNILATITGNIDGAAAGTTNPEELVYTTTTEPEAAALATWKKNLTFKDTGDTITYTITIKNDSESRKIKASIINNSATGDAITQNITLTVNGATETYTSGEVYEIDPQKTAVVVATFTVDADVSGSGSYGYTINLQDENALAPAEADAALASELGEVLAANNITSASTLEEVMTAFKDSGYEQADMATEAKDTYLYWVKEANAIVYADADDQVISTTSLAREAMSPTTQTWISLSGQIPTADYTVEDGIVTITSAKQLVKLANDIHDSVENKIAGTDTVVTGVVLANDIDMRGTDISFGDMGAIGTWTPDGGANITPPIITNFTFDGDNHNLINFYGVKDDTVAPEDPSELYEKTKSGFVSTNRGTVTFKDITIADGVFGTMEINHSSIFVGYNLANTDGARGTLIVENVKVNNCTIYGREKVGTFVGNSSEGSLIIKGDTQIRNTAIYTSGGEAGAVWGYHTSSYKFKCDDYTDPGSTADMNSLGTKITVEQPNTLIDDSVFVAYAPNPYYTQEAKDFVDLIMPETTSVTVKPDTAFGTASKYITSNDVFEMGVPLDGYITAWELEDNAPKLKNGKLIVRGSTARYGFVGQKQYAGAFIYDGENKMTWSDGTTEYELGLAYTEVPVNNVSDLGKLWCDFYPNSTLSTATWYL